MSKKKSEKEAKEKKRPAKKAPAKPLPATGTSGESEVVALKESKTKAKKAKEAPGKKSAVEISNDDIGLRAYFIAERRAKMGWHGDSTGDWIEAERQLKAEAARKK